MLHKSKLIARMANEGAIDEAWVTYGHWELRILFPMSLAHWGNYTSIESATTFTTWVRRYGCIWFRLAGKRRFRFKTAVFPCSDILVNKRPYETT